MASRDADPVTEVSLIDREPGPRLEDGDHLIIPLDRHAVQRSDDGRLLCRLSTTLHNEGEGETSYGAVSMDVGGRTCIQVLVERNTDGSLTANYLTLIRSGEIRIPVGESASLDLVNFAQRDHVNDVRVADVHTDPGDLGVSASVERGTALMRTSADESELTLSLSEVDKVTQRSSVIVEAARAGNWEYPTGDVTIEIFKDDGIPVHTRTVGFGSKTARSSLVLSDLAPGDYNISATSEAFNGPTTVQRLRKEPQGPWIWVSVAGGVLVVVALTRMRWWRRCLAAGLLVAVAAALAFVGRDGTVRLEALDGVSEVVVEPETQSVEPNIAPPTSVYGHLDAVALAVAGGRNIPAVLVNESSLTRLEVICVRRTATCDQDRGTRSVTYRRTEDTLQAKVETS